MDHNFYLHPGVPNFFDLPWDLPLSQWEGKCPRLESLPRGPSRHPVVFVNYDGLLYGIKELPISLAKTEYERLTAIESTRLPAVTPLGYGLIQRPSGQVGVLITRYLDCSLPYRILFMSAGLLRYQEGLLDAMAGLLVQLHLADIYWGDCSLSNTLFRYDAGALRAYLVDAETAEVYPDDIPTAQRYHDLEIMEENVDGELADLRLEESNLPHLSVIDIGAYIRLRYQSLWQEITREDIINPGENYRIQERIRALNDLGFSVGEVELAETRAGSQLRLRVVVTDRNFHRDQLQNLTSIDAEEQQAQKIMNEIQELKATLSTQNNRSVPISVAAYHWLECNYQPILDRLKPLVGQRATAPELYCQVLEHKWFLSEKERRDVGHQVAADDYLRQFSIRA
jgi:hypothetical protein